MEEANILDPKKPVENRDELGRFGPNNNANPNGRPKGKTFSGYLREILESIDPETKKENFAVLADVLLRVAKSGDVAAIREFADRIDGRPQQAIEHSGEIKGNAIVFSTFKDEADSKPEV